MEALAQNFYLFFTTMVTAIAVENAIFARSLGLSKGILFINRPQAGILYGALFTWTVTLASFFVAAVNALLRGSAYQATLRIPLFLLCVLLVYAGTYLLTRHKLPGIHRLVARALPISTFNSALFAAFYVSAIQSFRIPQTIGYALGTGIGYTLAILIIYYARKRLAISPVPRSFRGLPVLLVYIGILSLAIYGLIGHGLPT